MKSVFSGIALFSLGFLFCGCASVEKRKPVSDEPLRLARDAAESTFQAGFFDRAESEWKRALNRAYVLGDNQAAAQCRYQMAVCQLAMGRVKTAQQTLGEARLEAMAEGDQSLAAQVEAVEARVLVSQGDAAGARDLSRRALARLQEGDSGRLQAEIHLILAEASIETKEQLPEARHFLKLALNAGGKRKDPAFQAVVDRVRGRILVMEGDRAREAAESYEAESEQWRKAGAHAERAGSLVRAALQRTLANDWLTAADHQLQAARIYAGTGQDEQARQAAVLAENWVKSGLEKEKMTERDQAKWEAVRRLSLVLQSELGGKLEGRPVH